MIPKHAYNAILSSPAGRLIDRLITEEHARGGDTSTPGAYGSIIDQLYETITGTEFVKEILDADKQPPEASTTFMTY
jgi:hypothetical protein